MTGEIEALRRLVNSAKRLVFFGGAGVSTASGIPDYRSMNGLYTQRYGGLSPEEMLSHSFLMLKPEEFFTFYRDTMLHPEAKPNIIHRWLRTLENSGKLLGIVTQNIDGLHRDSGSIRLFELHGSVRENECMDCGASYPMSWMVKSTGIPRCPDCGGVVRPCVCLYGEALNPHVLRGARRVTASADVLLVAGTSLAVEPAASLIDDFQGKAIAVINREPTPADSRASLIIRGDAAAIIGELAE